LVLSIVDARVPYRYREIRVVVERIESDPDKEFVNSMARKDLDQDANNLGHRPDEERVVIVVRPERTAHMG
jgi:hypothetical protein